MLREDLPAEWFTWRQQAETRCINYKGKGVIPSWGLEARGLGMGLKLVYFRWVWTWISG